MRHRPKRMVLSAQHGLRIERKELAAGLARSRISVQEHFAAKWPTLGGRGGSFASLHGQRCHAPVGPVGGNPEPVVVAGVQGCQVPGQHVGGRSGEVERCSSNFAEAASRTIV